MTEETAAVEGEIESAGEMETMYNELSIAISGIIGAQLEGKNIEFYQPVLDALSRNVIATLMMLPEEVRETTLMTFAQRTATFFREALRLEKGVMGEASRIITLN